MNELPQLVATAVMILVPVFSLYIFAIFIDHCIAMRVERLNISHLPDGVDNIVENVNRQASALETVLRYLSSHLAVWGIAITALKLSNLTLVSQGDTSFVGMDSILPLFNVTAICLICAVFNSVLLYIFRYRKQHFLREIMDEYGKKPSSSQVKQKIPYTKQVLALHREPVVENASAEE